MATINDFVNPTVLLLGNRSDAIALAPQNIANAIVELTDAYPFEELRETGPIVQFTPGVANYLSSIFVQSAPTPVHLVNKIVSWFFYLQPPANLFANPNIGNANPGYELKFREISDLEVLYNTLSLPMFWSQLGESPTAKNLIVAATPQLPYYTYMRYQWKHPFTYPIASTSDPVYTPFLWNDIIQYAAAARIALQLRMQDVADRYHNVIFGDPEFQRSSGGRGQPGLIARRISQTQKNQSASLRQVRLQRSRY